MTSAASRPTGLPMLANFRDLGGLSTADGAALRTGRLFRSSGLAGLAGDDRALVDSLGLSRVYDFRSADEVSASPDPDLAGVDNVHLDVLADSPRAIAANLPEMLTDASRAAEVTAELSKPEVAQAMKDTYRGFVSYPSARASYRAFVTGLLDAGAAPALFHCTAGKDRTGWAAAALLTLMGVSRDDVYGDYLRTNEQLLPACEPLFTKFAAVGGDPEVLRPVFGVLPVYLDAAFDEVDREFGSVAGYFADGLGIDDAAQRELRALYVN